MNVLPKICMRKLGMDQILYKSKEVGATFLCCERLVVLGHKTIESDGYSSMILGYGEKKIEKANKPQHYLFKSIDNNTACEKVYETRMHYKDNEGPDSIINKYDYFTTSEKDSGTYTTIEINQLFKVGDYVDVTSNTKGKGFAGVMKRHNFKCGNASHGTSLAHRWAGSTGNRTQPGRVFKGKKMAGRYGNEQITIQNLRIVFSEKILLKGVERYIIGVHGAVPGAAKGLCFVKNAVKRGVK